MNCTSESKLGFVDPIRSALFLVPLTEGFQMQRQRRAHPRRSLGMITDLIVGVGMYQSAERTSIDHQPADKCSELHWGEDIHLEHCDWMRADGSIEDFINP
jgi:hypothetical protein